MTKKIESLQNEKIKQIVKLRDSSRERQTAGRFVIEGYREISLALAGDAEIVNLIYCPDYLKKELAVAEEKIIAVPKKVFNKISCRENPDGFLAVAKIRERQLEDIKLSNRPLVIILEAVEKPGNLGAIFRTADAVGADAVIINDPKTDIYNPNVIRASQGTVFAVPTAVSSIEETIKFCQKNKMKIFATTPAAKLEYDEADYGSGSAIVLGAEDKGLSKKWLEAVDEKIKIKMRGKIDSLNVSASAAVILFEVARQRGKID